MKKGVYIAILAALVVVSAGVGVWLGLRDDNGSVVQTRVPSTVAVELGEVRRTVIAPGQAAYREIGIASASRPGEIAELFSARGDAVRAGDVIGLLDSTSARTALAAAEKSRDFAIEKNTADAEIARLQLESARLMLEELQLRSGESESTPTEGDLALATLEVKRAEVRLESLGRGVGPGLYDAVAAAKTALAETTITAGMDGVVAEVFVSPGQSVQFGSPIMRIVKPDDLEIRVTVIEEDLPLVQVGQLAEILFDAAPADPVAGRVERISPVRVPGEPRPLYMVFITLDEPVPSLKGGMTADASLVVVSEPSALRLPRSLVRGSSGSSVRLSVLKDGVVEKRTVTVGIRGDVYASIADGLSVGELVVAE